MTVSFRTASVAAARKVASEAEAPDGVTRYVIAAVLIAAATCLGYFWASIPDPRNLSLLFFAAILAAGMWLGMRPALFAALLAFLCYNFFLVEPRLELHFAPADFLAFASFLVGAVLVGGLAGRVSDRARDARNRLRDLTALFEASRDLSHAVEPEDAASRVVRHLERYGCTAAIWLSDETAVQLAAVSEPRRAEAGAMQEAVRKFTASGHHACIEPGRWLFQLKTGERQLGCLGLWFEVEVRSAPANRRWIEAMLELGAVAIDRARLISEVAEGKIIVEKEGLRTALLSSLSHDLRTPISTILASATSLQEHDERFDVETKRDLLETIQEESERLNRYIANLLEMTRLESGALEVKSVLLDPGEAMSSALERLASRMRGRRVVRAFRTSGERIFVDPVLIEQALVNLLENAIAYSPSASEIIVSTRCVEDEILLSVEDSGPGISPRDMNRIFDKFFRGQSDRRSGSGVGLGLSVAHGLVQAFGGRIRAVSPAAGGKGTRMEVSLPAHPAMETVE